MHNRELEEQLREQLEESKECIQRLLNYFDDLHEVGSLNGLEVRVVVIRDAEKFLEKLNEK